MYCDVIVVMSSHKIYSSSFVSHIPYCYSFNVDITPYTTLHFPLLTTTILHYAPSQDLNRQQHVAHSYLPTSGWYSFTSQLSDTANGLSRRIEVRNVYNVVYSV
jgi:aryl-alcohol dehydrogenase-like predicted oxidoreductase